MKAIETFIVGGVGGEMGGFFNDAFIYRVPLYQRHYVWSSINWEHLWNDIEEKSELRREKVPKVHFTGAIVIQEIHSAGLMEIVDGQQRLTTFQIILCVIRDLCNEFFEALMNLQTNIDNYISLPPLSPVEDILDFDWQYKLLPREGTDRAAFLSLIKRTHENVEKSSRIWEAYEYFKNKIRVYVNNDYNRLQTLYDSIIADFEVVKIELTSEEEYANIFRSINATGRHLVQFDLLRNDIFRRADGTNRDSLYKNYWSHFEEDANWREGAVLIADDFLENFLKIKLGEDFDEKFELFDLYELYCTKLTKELNRSETDPKLVQYEFYDLKRYSSVYQELHIADSENIGERIKFYDEFKDKLEVVNQLEIVDQLKLFILYITNEFGLSGCELNRIFDLFEAYVVRGMLHIGSRGYESPLLRELNNLFLSTLVQKLRALDREKSLNLISLVYFLSREWVTDKEVKVALKRLPQTEATREKKRSNLMRDFGGSYIFDVLGWDIDHKTELFDKFCEKWPSAEVMLQKELIGDLPIVYSRIPISIETIAPLGFDSETHAFAQAMPRLENYVFVTYQSTWELSEYEINENSVTGTEVKVNSEQYKKVTLDLKEILFAFPTKAMSSMQNHINRIQDDVKNQKLQPVSRQDAFPTKDWLFDEVAELWMRVEHSDSKHWLLANKEAIVFTRAGHELHGKLKSFNDNAIYMEINEHIVTIYMHGVYELKRKTHRKKEKRRGRLA